MIDVEPLIVYELGRMLPLPDGSRADWTDVLDRAGVRGHQPRRRLVLALVVAFVLAAPALALSGVLGSLFGFSNHGRPVSRNALSRISAVLHLTRARPRTFVQLVSRDGFGVYAAHGKSGNLCFFVGPAAQTDLKPQDMGGGCINAKASARFPSPSFPVWDMSIFSAGPGVGAPGAAVERLFGVAADGVRSVQVLAYSDCHIVATSPVTNNVYIDAKLPLIPDAFIVARDRRGNAVWHESVQPIPKASSCGLGK